MNITRKNNFDKPDFFNSNKVKEIYRVPYQKRAAEAETWAQFNNIKPAFADKKQVGLLLIDVQNTFCIPDFELFVNGAVEDNVRLCEFIYRNLSMITEIIPTMDSHTAIQIFHPIFWLNQERKHPAPATMI
ncbi:MAG: isochorismatase, partial [Pleurocapsa sp.]